MNKPYKTIIIDDELLARERLLKLIENFPQIFNVIETAKNRTEAKEKINSLQPDVIFLDIEMPGLIGFELLDELKILPLVIFCTAFDQYALQAFETHSVDYLVKPVRLERLEKTVEKFKGNSNSQHLLEAIKQMTAKKEVKKNTSITVKKGEKLFFVKLEEILYFEADAKYVTIHTKTEGHLSEISLTQLEQKLPDYFLRVQKGVIINTEFVKNVQKYFNSRFIITLKDKKLTLITTGRSYNDAVKNWMNF
jgi:two-component system LytT family response regulator